MVLSARVLQVEEFFQLGGFTAASVQRDYVWDAQQSEDMLADIERACSAHSPEPDPGLEAGPVISIATGEEEENGSPEENVPLDAGQDEFRRLSSGFGGRPAHWPAEIRNFRWAAAHDHAHHSALRASRSHPVQPTAQPDRAADP